MSNNAYLALWLEAPLQSWGFNSHFTNRSTGNMPTKSGLVGMFCAALGFCRGSKEEEKFLALARKLFFTMISIPKLRNGKIVPIKRMIDFHTVSGIVTAEGKERSGGTQTTQRTYLADAIFAVIVEGNKSILEKIGRALVNPVWGIWLGRKCCVPTKPVFRGVFNNKEKAQMKLLGNKSISNFDRQIEVKKYLEGTDSINDQPISFGKHLYGLRRVLVLQSGQK